MTQRRPEAADANVRSAPPVGTRSVGGRADDGADRAAVPEPTQEDRWAMSMTRPVVWLGVRADALGTRIDGWPVWLRWVLTATLLLAVAAPLVASYVAAQQTMSRADEYVYIDAVEKATRGDVTQRGELIDEYALSVLSCRGVEGYPMGSPCGGPYSRENVPWEGGRTSADIHPPTYFFLTAVLAKLVIATTPADDLLTAARLTGALWLGLGLTVVVALARSLGATRSAAGAAALLALMAPAMRWVSTFVTPDALNVLAGASIALVAVQVVKGRWHPAWLVLATFLAGSIKAQNALAAGLVALFLVLMALRQWIADRSGRPVRAVLWSVAALVAALVPQLVWMVIRSASALGEAPGQGLAAPALGRYDVLYDSIVFVRGIIVGPNATYPAAWANGSPLTIHGEVVAWILLSGAVALALFVADRTALQTTFGRAVLLALILGGPALRVGLYALTGANFGTPVRYGMVLFPAVVAATAVVSRRRWVNVLLLGAGLAFALALLTQLESW